MKKYCRIDGSDCLSARCIICLKFESYQSWVEQSGEFVVLCLGRNMTIVPAKSKDVHLVTENG